MTTDPHAEPMARRIQDLSRAVATLSAYWEDNGLAGDYFDETSGYPFTESLDEVAARVAEWARIAFDRMTPLDSVNARVTDLIARGILAVHDGALPYIFEIVATRSDSQLTADLRARFPLLVEWSDMTDASGLAITEDLLNVNAETGRVDPSLPIPVHLDQLAELLTVLEALPGEQARRA